MHSDFIVELAGRGCISFARLSRPEARPQEVEQGRLNFDWSLKYLNRGLEPFIQIGINSSKYLNGDLTTLI